MGWRDIFAKFLKAQAPSGRTVLLYFYLLQDLDILLPIARALKSTGLEVRAFVSPILTEQSPRVASQLTAENVPWTSKSAGAFAEDPTPDFSDVAALITAADTTARPHRPAHLSVKKAKRLGIRTYTIQHGLENNGLTYYDREYPPSKVDFASETIFTWCGLEQLHPDVPRKIRRRCVPVGNPKNYATGAAPEFSSEGYRKVISVFENLHWNRYSPIFRTTVLADLVSTARSHPDFLFIVKPHHAGQWLTKRFKGDAPTSPNVVIADPADKKWEPFTAPALIQVSDAVITTPSTTAIDAASKDKPVAVIGYDLTLPIYTPLSILRSQADWAKFLGELDEPAKLANEMQKTTRFRTANVLDGDAASRLVRHISEDLKRLEV